MIWIILAFVGGNILGFSIAAILAASKRAELLEEIEDKLNGKC